MTQAITQHLWEPGHPYYCCEGNFYRNNADGAVHTHYPSWGLFFEDWGNTDPDMNLVFRWDWHHYYPGDDYDSAAEHDTLEIFWVLQRKAILRSTYVEVRPEDEPAVRAWLTERAKTIAAIWSPLNLAVEVS